MTLRSQYNTAIAKTSPFPLSLEITSARGANLYGIDEKKYLDFISGIGVSNLGHHHPDIIQAIHDQADLFLHTMVYGEHIQAPQVLLADLLTSQLPPSLNQVYFHSSGTEAIEAAMKLARKLSGRPTLISCTNAYHGSTQGALSLMSNEYFTSAFRPLIPGIQFLDPEKPDFELLTGQTACMVMELIKSEEGCKPLSKEFVQQVAAICKAKNILLVIDECQTGFGRTGELFAFRGYDITPDILVLGKALGGGMPLGAFITDKAIMDNLTHSPVLGHITTFGGHPVCCAAGLAAFSYLTESQCYLDAIEKSLLFQKLLNHPKIKSVSGKGLLLAVEFESEDYCLQVIRQCIEHGLFTDWFLFAPQCLRIAPPLTISNQLIERSCEIILNVLNN